MFYCGAFNISCAGVTWSLTSYYTPFLNKTFVGTEHSFLWLLEKRRIYCCRHIKCFVLCFSQLVSIATKYTHVQLPCIEYYLLFYSVELIDSGLVEFSHNTQSWQQCQYWHQRLPTWKQNILATKCYPQWVLNILPTFFFVD